MKIVIAGTGDTAVHLAEMLSHENQDVVVIGRESNVLAELDSYYNLLTYTGSPVTPSDLRGAGVSGCDLFIAVTPYENHNLVASQLAKWMGARRTLARVDNGEWLRDAEKGHFKATGVDELVYPEMLASHEIRHSLRHPWLHSVYPLHSGAMTTGAVRVSAGAPVAGTRLRDFDKKLYKIHICAIKRDGVTIIPDGDISFENGDLVYFTATPDADEKMLIELFGKRRHKIENVMIAGGGKMTRAVASIIQDQYSITIIDPDAQVCDRVASICDRCTVVCADFRDVAQLREEGIKHCDAFIALSDSAEKNIVCSLMARSLGVPHTIAEIEDIQYFAEADDLNIDVVVNKKLLTSSTIYQMLLDSYLESPRCLAFEAAEVAEIVAKDRSPITKKQVKDLKLDRSMTIAAVVHDDVASLVSGETQIMPGDHVVVFCLQGHLKQVERLFS